MPDPVKKRKERIVLDMHCRLLPAVLLAILLHAPLAGSAEGSSSPERPPEHTTDIPIPGMLFGGPDAHSRRNAPLPPLVPPPPATNAPSEQTMPAIPDTPIRTPAPASTPVRLDTPLPDADAPSMGRTPSAPSVPPLPEQAPQPPTASPPVPEIGPEPEFETPLPHAFSTDTLPVSRTATAASDTRTDLPPPASTPGRSADPFDLPTPDIDDEPRFVDVRPERIPAPSPTQSTRVAPPASPTDAEAEFAPDFDMPDFPDTPGLRRLEDAPSVNTAAPDTKLPDSSDNTATSTPHHPFPEPSPAPDAIMTVDDLPLPTLPGSPPASTPTPAAPAQATEPTTPEIEMPEHEEMPSPWEEVPAPPTPPAHITDPSEESTSLDVPTEQPPPSTPVPQDATPAETSKSARLLAALTDTLNERGLDIPRAEIDATLHTLRTEWEQHATPGQSWDAHLAERGYAPEQFREELRIAASLRALVLHTLAPTEADLQAYHAMHQARYTTPDAVTLRWIRIDPVTFAPASAPQPTPAHWKQAADLSERLYRRIVEDGEPFEAVAAKHSHDLQTREAGGRLGTVTQADLPPDLAGTAFRLAPGLVSPPLQTAEGYTILLVESRVPARPLPFAEVADRVRQDFEEDMIRSSSPILREQFLREIANDNHESTPDSEIPRKTFHHPDK